MRVCFISHYSKLAGGAEGVDSSVKCNGLSKSDFDVFSKVGQHCLERGFITEAFAWSDTNGIYF